MKRFRKAKVKEARAIYELLSQEARKGLLLPRSLNAIYENIRDFWVCEEKGEVLGCVALHVVWEDLAEIRSLVVKEERRGEGIGFQLVRLALLEAGELEVKRVFSLTYVKEFFLKNFPFKEIDKRELPHKVWGECVNCVKFPDCDEEAVLIDLTPRVLEELSQLVPGKTLP